MVQDEQVRLVHLHLIGASRALVHQVLALELEAVSGFVHIIRLDLVNDQKLLLLLEPE